MFSVTQAAGKRPLGALNAGIGPRTACGARPV